MSTWLCDLAQSRLPKKTLGPSVTYSMPTGGPRCRKYLQNDVYLMDFEAYKTEEK